MAYSQEPDKKEIYKREDESLSGELRLIVKHYDDFSEVVSWHIEDKNGDVIDADQASLGEIAAMIDMEGWKELKD
jgi:hypothetical protein